MLDTIFQGIFDTDTSAVIALGDFLLCVGCALLLGLLLSAAYLYKARYSRSFVAALALLPAVVCVVIMMVNGNIGTGVAVAGAFSLIRFRSAQGTAKEIAALFVAMGAGLIAGMDYLAYAFLFTVILSAAGLVYAKLNFGAGRRTARERTLTITIPEDLDYGSVFTEPLKQYTSAYALTEVKTTNLGSLFRLRYDVTLRSGDGEKALIDALRCRNGNLEICVSPQSTLAQGL